MSTMRYLDHLQELRKRIIYSFIFFITSVLLGFFVATPVIQFLKPEELDLNTFALGDALSIYVKIATIIGFTLSLPFFLYQIWAFVRPGLKPAEQKIALRYIPAAAMLFVLGILFGYFILFPLMIDFMVQITDAAGATLLLGLNQYFGFLFGVTIPMSILFELPILVIFLTRIHILTPMLMQKFRKIAYFILIVIATIITPAEIITDILVSIPLILLYEISLWLSKYVYRKLQKEKTIASNQAEDI